MTILLICFILIINNFFTSERFINNINNTLLFNKYKNVLFHDYKLVNPFIFKDNINYNSHNIPKSKGIVYKKYHKIYCKSSNQLLYLMFLHNIIGSILGFFLLKIGLPQILSYGFIIIFNNFSFLWFYYQFDAEKNLIDYYKLKFKLKYFIDIKNIITNIFNIILLYYLLYNTEKYLQNTNDKVQKDAFFLSIYGYVFFFIIFFFMIIIEFSSSVKFFYTNTNDHHKEYYFDKNFIENLMDYENFLKKKFVEYKSKPLILKLDSKDFVINSQDIK